MNVELVEMLTSAIGTAIQEQGEGVVFSAEDIRNHISQTRPELIERLSKELGLTPESAQAWLQARIESILKKLMLRVCISNN